MDSTLNSEKINEIANELGVLDHIDEYTEDDNGIDIISAIITEMYILVGMYKEIPRSGIYSAVLWSKRSVRLSHIAAVYGIRVKELPFCTIEELVIMIADAMGLIDNYTEIKSDFGILYDSD